jgi:tetratricopeptide (TPR) repeat protein
VSSLALERWVRGHSTSRYPGPKAQLGELRAKLRISVEKGDHAAEHLLSKELARALIAQGAELDRAIALARRALELRDDSDLRADLSGWYASLGEMPLAAATLEPLCASLTGKAGARALTRMAVLAARAADAETAAKALQAAAQRDLEDPIPLELLAAISGWGSAIVSKQDASKYYLEAASRREIKQDKAGAYEDLLRAFEAAPESTAAAETLSSALFVRGLAAAADEVMRQHGDALGSLSGNDAAGKAVHETRFRQALQDRDWPRALAAGFDAGLDTTVDLVPLLGTVKRVIASEPMGEVSSFDELLAELGLFEMLSARLELGGLRGPRSRRGELLGYVASFRASRSLSPGSQEADDAVRIARAQLVTGDPVQAMTTLAQALPNDKDTGRAAGLLWSFAAEQGAASARAGAMSLLASFEEGPLASVLHTVATQHYLLAGEQQSALQMAEAACHADPGSVRAMAIYAEATFGSALRVTALSMERAMALGIPRSHLCRELAVVMERLQEPALALAWTQRWLALSPGDPQAARSLLLRAVEAQDAKRLADALTWLLAQPLAHSVLSQDVARALRALARLDGEHGKLVARRALDTLGPRDEAVSAAVLEVADWLGERRLGIAVIERQIASGVLGDRRAEGLVELAVRRREGMDPNGAARCLVRALAEGAPAVKVAAEVSQALDPSTGDGQLAIAQVTAELATLDTSAPPDAVAAALRGHGAALWDLAGDQDGAFAVWERAAMLDRRRGLEQMSRDLVAFAGPAFGRQKLLELAARQHEPAQAARALALVAGLAIDAGDRRAAFEHAEQALALDPRRADALALVERAATHDDIPELHRIYDVTLKAQLGCYGVRALSYRAARKLERLGEHDAALAFSIRAFEAVPADGVTLALMLRLAAQLNQTPRAVAVLEAVAQKQAGTAAGEHWNQRAIDVASRAEGGVRHRVEQALHALHQSVTVEGIRSLGGAISEWLAQFPGDQALALRTFDELARKILINLQAPKEAGVALAVAQVALDNFPRLPTAMQAAGTALRLDPTDEDFAVLVKHATRLAELSGAQDFAKACVERLADAGTLVNTALLDLAHKVFAALGDEASAARALIIGSQREQGNLELYRRAASAAAASDDRALLRQLNGTLRGSSEPHVVRVARAVAERGEIDNAIALLEPVRVAAAVDAMDLQQVRGELIELYRKAGQQARLAELLTEEVTTLGAREPEYVERVLELARLHATLQNPQQALGVLGTALQARADSVDLLQESLNLARALGDTQTERVILSTWADREKDPARKVQRLHELAQLAEKLGDAPGVETALKRILEREPGNLEALTTLCRLAEQNHEWPRAVELLEQQRAATTDVEHRRELGLRRAQILENRLNKSAEAHNALEQLLIELGEDLKILQALAEAYDKSHDLARAAPLWERASRLAAERSLKQQLLLRACHAYLEVGDDKNARQILSQSGPLSGSLSAANLRVAVERRTGDPVGLARALEELALVSPDAPEERANILLEAARVSLHAERQDVALVLAERAVRILPSHAQAVFLARLIEYRQRGAGTREQAIEMVHELRRIASRDMVSPLGPQEEAVRRFILVEALDVAEGPAAGLGELRAIAGNEPQDALLALALAERLQRAGDHLAAVPVFARALAGEFHGLRRRGPVLLAAARSAQRVNDFERAEQWLRAASDLAETHDEAQQRLKTLHEPPPSLRTQSLVPTPEPPPAAVGADTSPSDAAHVAAGLAAAEHGSIDPGVPGPRTLLFGVKRRPSGTIEVSATGPTKTASTKPSPLIPVGMRSVQGAEMAPLPPSRRSLPAPDSPPELASEESLPLVRRQASLPATPPPAAVTPRPPSLAPARPTASEPELLAALGRGDVAAGVELAATLRQQPERSRDLVRVCRQLCDTAPGDISFLTFLHDATSRDGDQVYARAVEHVLEVFKGGQEIVPPPLGEQIEQPEEINALLFHATRTPAGEVLGMIWQWAGPLFWREAAQYGVTGVERLAPHSPTPLGQACMGAVRALGLLRTPIFCKRSDQALSITPAALNPPALVIEGDIGEVGGELSYWLGVALCATLPEQVLLATLPAEQIDNILRAVGAAFGPPHSSRAGLASVAQLAGGLWERIPAREQRRLQALCLEHGALDREKAVAGAQQAARRAGLFICGDLFYALCAMCLEEGIDASQLSPETFLQLCRQRPEAADLVRLATSAEYAAARWQNAKPQRPTPRPPV